jgi:hypothetical protein
MAMPSEQVLSERVMTPDEKVWLECFHCKVPCHHTVIAVADVERLVGDDAGRERDVHQLVLKQAKIVDPTTKRSE